MCVMYRLNIHEKVLHIEYQGQLETLAHWNGPEGIVFMISRFSAHHTYIYIYVYIMYVLFIMQDMRRLGD